MEKLLSRRKPDWLKIKLPKGKNFADVQSIVRNHNLHTICTSGKCPNLSECWSARTATLMIGGDVCTRACKFCNTKSGRPRALDVNEPENVARSVQLMGLKHAVITSVDRDDLPDQGAMHWVRTIEAIKDVNPGTTMEVLIPDFQGDKALIQMVIDAEPNVISHNMETVRRLTPQVRSAARYEVSLQVLKQIAESGTVAKSGIMLGLGETREEILETMDDLRSVGVNVMTIGQYLQPSKEHLEVQEYVTPEVFKAYEKIGLEKGFKAVESAPFARSSYHAERHV